MNIQTNKITPEAKSNGHAVQRKLTAASEPQQRIMERNASLVQSITATFNSANEDKASTTEVSVSVERRSDNLRLGNGQSNKTAFAKNSSHAVSLTPENGATREDYNNARVSVNIRPEGNERWDFSLTLRMAFADGSTMTNTFSDHWLNQDIRGNAYDCYSAAA
jgi:hypothetical protein